MVTILNYSLLKMSSREPAQMRKPSRRVADSGDFVLWLSGKQPKFRLDDKHTHVKHSGIRTMCGWVYCSVDKKFQEEFREKCVGSRELWRPRLIVCGSGWENCGWILEWCSWWNWGSLWFSDGCRAVPANRHQSTGNSNDCAVIGFLRWNCNLHDDGANPFLRAIMKFPALWTLMLLVTHISFAI